jgi:hypothetical protein
MNLFKNVGLGQSLNLKNVDCQIQSDLTLGKTIQYGALSGVLNWFDLSRRLGFSI